MRTMVEGEMRMTDNDLHRFTQDQENYLDWLALPRSLRTPKTKQEYAELIKISRMGLWKWEQLPGFDDERRQRIKCWQRESTPEIIDKLKDKALTGDVSAVKTWLEWVEGMESKLQVEHSGKITVDAIKAWLTDDKQ